MSTAETLSRGSLWFWLELFSVPIFSPCGDYSNLEAQVHLQCLERDLSVSEASFADTLSCQWAVQIHLDDSKSCL